MILTSRRQAFAFFSRFCLFLSLLIITCTQVLAQHIYKSEEIYAEGGVPEGSLILMADGSEKPIEKIQTGDIIAAYDPAIEQMVTTTVLSTQSYSGELRPAVSVMLVLEELSASLQKNGGTLGIIMEANVSQPLLTQWGKKEAGQLKEGDRLYTFDGHTDRFHLFTVYEVTTPQQAAKPSFQLITDKQNYLVNGVVVIE